MRSLTEAVRKSPDYDILTKLSTYIRPETNLADSIGDYLLNSPKIKINWNNRIGELKSLEGFYVYIENTDLKHVQKDMFEVSDPTGFCIAYIDVKEDKYPQLDSLNGKADLLLIKHRPKVSRLICGIYNKDHTVRRIIEKKPVVEKHSLESLSIIPGFCPA